MEEKRLAFNLFLFDGEGAGGAATGASETAVAAGQNAESNVQTDIPDNIPTDVRERFVKHRQSLAVKTPAPDAAIPNEADKPVTEPEKTVRVPLNELLKDESYKAEFQAIFDKRFGENKGVQEQLKKQEATLKALSPALDALAAKHGVDRADIAGLAKAVANDPSYYEGMAMEKGIPAEAAKQMALQESQIREYNERDAEYRAQQEEAQKHNAFIVRLRSEVTEAQKEFPQLDIVKEGANPKFDDLVRNKGVDVLTAFKAVHLNEIMSGAIAQATKDAQQKTVKSIQANASRPVENGMAGSVGANTNFDVNSMSREQRQALIEEARNNPGKRIMLHP